MNYFLGLDGGGTKTAFTVIDENKNIVFECVGGPTSIDTVSLEEARNTILENTKDINFPISFVYAGIGGISTIEDIDKVNAILKEIKCLINKDNVNSGNDVNNALYGGLDGKDGIILIAGTGCVSFGMNKKNYKRTGGYSYKEGDAGSAYDLGFKALQYLARAIDGRNEKTVFSKELEDAINCHDYASLAHFFNEASRTNIAKLARIVTRNEKNKYAKKIIIESAKEAALNVNTTYKDLKFASKVNLAIIGSLGNANTLYRKVLLKNLNSKIKVIDKINEASMGSCIKAIEEFKKI